MRRGTRHVRSAKQALVTDHIRIHVSSSHAFPLFMPHRLSPPQPSPSVRRPLSGWWRHSR